MKYEILQNNPPVTGLIVMMVIAIITLILTAFAPNGITGTIAVIVMIISIFVIYNSVNNVYEISKSNTAAATENLKLKYDIREVYWDAKESSANPKDTKSNENIVVESSNGKKYVFKYKVDLKSSEPTLSDMPIAGGTNPADAVSAESLLKNK